MSDVLLENLPPKTDYISYLTIIESRISIDTLPTLNKILQDPNLTQNIGWDLIHLLLPIPGSITCLTTIARLGNPREVILKVTEALQLLRPGLRDNETCLEKDIEPTSTQKFCILISLLSILHPRIKTKYPSRFLSATFNSILSTFQPSNLATLAVISFLHTISGRKRPLLPDRNSSFNWRAGHEITPEACALDPEAQDEEPEEEAIKTKLLQSFITRVLESYILENPLEWSARIQESFRPEKVVEGRSIGKSFREDSALQTRDTIAGQLVALARDLGLVDYSNLLEIISETESVSSTENNPDSVFPGNVAFSKTGSLFLITSYVFSSIVFQSKLDLPDLKIFPDHAKLITRFIGINGPAEIGGEESGVIDAILALGLWLENENKFIAGSLQDQEFLEYLQLLSLLSANTPSSSLRYAAHVLCSHILHAHPVDRVRLSFISDTLEHCPFDTLRASAVSWLKDEIMTAMDRKSNTVFTSSAALVATQPFLFPSLSDLYETNDENLMHGIAQSFPFHMAILNFLLFISGERYSHITPPGMLKVVEDIYLQPLKSAQERLLSLVSQNPDDNSESMIMDLHLLGERIKFYFAQIKTDN
ncbi:hypothetical protein K3495_g1259 [Podosphaera aphanis]|nr:hypothetical protein K3495_g1259 [Podosphaera aphanis]